MSWLHYFSSFLEISSHFHADWLCPLLKLKYLPLLQGKTMHMHTELLCISWHKCVRLTMWEQITCWNTGIQCQCRDSGKPYLTCRKICLSHRSCVMFTALALVLWTAEDVWESTRHLYLGTWIAPLFLFLHQFLAYNGNNSCASRAWSTEIADYWRKCMCLRSCHMQLLENHPHLEKIPQQYFEKKGLMLKLQ